MPDIDPATLTDEQIRAVMAEAGRRGATKREYDERVCWACGIAIPAALKSRRYCSDACRCKAAYWRDKVRAGDDPTAPFQLGLGGLGWTNARTYTRKPKKGHRH